MSQSLAIVLSVIIYVPLLGLFVFGLFVKPNAVPADLELDLRERDLHALAIAGSQLARNKHREANVFRQALLENKDFLALELAAHPPGYVARLNRSELQALLLRTARRVVGGQPYRQRIA